MLSLFAGVAPSRVALHVVVFRVAEQWATCLLLLVVEGRYIASRVEALHLVLG